MQANCVPKRASNAVKMKMEAIELVHDLVYHDSIPFCERIRLITYIVAETGEIHKHLLSKIRSVCGRSITERKIEHSNGEVTDHKHVEGMEDEDVVDFENTWQTLWQPDVTELDTDKYDQECMVALGKLQRKYFKHFDSNKPDHTQKNNDETGANRAGKPPQGPTDHKSKYHAELGTHVAEKPQGDHPERGPYHPELGARSPERPHIADHGHKPNNHEGILASNPDKPTSPKPVHGEGEHSPAKPGKKPKNHARFGAHSPEKPHGPLPPHPGHPGHVPGHHPNLGAKNAKEPHGLQPGQKPKNHAKLGVHRPPHPVHDRDRAESGDNKRHDMHPAEHDLGKRRNPHGKPNSKVQFKKGNLDAHKATTNAKPQQHDNLAIHNIKGNHVSQSEPKKKIKPIKSKRENKMPGAKKGINKRSRGGRNQVTLENKDTAGSQALLMKDDRVFFSAEGYDVSIQRKTANSVNQLVIKSRPKITLKDHGDFDAQKKVHTFGLKNGKKQIDKKDNRKPKPHKKILSPGGPAHHGIMFGSINDDQGHNLVEIKANLKKT